MAYYFRYTNNEFDNLFPKIRVAEFKQLPIKQVSKSSQNKLSENCSKMIFRSKELSDISLKFQFYLQKQYAIEKLPTKLAAWHELDFSDFIKELNKAIKAAKSTPLSKKDEFEWLELFEENKQKALAIKEQIDQTDKEIDQMVYELYGLTEEEIRIVEGN